MITVIYRGTMIMTDISTIFLIFSGSIEPKPVEIRLISILKPFYGLQMISSIFGDFGCQSQDGRNASSSNLVELYYIKPIFFYLAISILKIFLV